MRILILGGTGMLGHKLLQVLGSEFDAWAAVRTLGPALQASTIFDANRTIIGVDAMKADSLASVVRKVRPAAVINAVGVVKQRPEGHDAIQSITINALMPHVLARHCAADGVRLVHISTDCVFSGARGQYTESDAPNADDLYGRSKLLGEVAGGCLTLRTSMIGRELTSRRGLVEWFLAQPGPRVPGFTRAIFSGLTTPVLSRVIGMVLREKPDLAGLYHVSADPISKFDLLRLLGKAFRRDVEVEARHEPAIDRSLDGRRFQTATGFTAPSWPDMIAELAGDPTPYDALNR